MDEKILYEELIQNIYTKGFKNKMFTEYNKKDFYIRKKGSGSTILKILNGDLIYFNPKPYKKKAIKFLKEIMQKGLKIETPIETLNRTGKHFL